MGQIQSSSARGSNENPARGLLRRGGRSLPVFARVSPCRITCGGLLPVLYSSIEISSRNQKVDAVLYYLVDKNRVGLVRTDASCVRQMGYLAIYFCVFSSVLLASFEVLPLRRTQVK